VASTSFNPSDMGVPGPTVRGPLPEPGPGVRAWAPGAVAEYGRPGVLAGPVGVQELFRRWPLVPSRELIRIRRALLQCRQMGGEGREHELSEPALALLDVVTSELERRRVPRTAGSGRAGEVVPDGRVL
jgi:hypothetical protein